MSTTTTIPPPKVYPAELKTLLQRGHAGDASVLPELKQAFLDNPELAAHLGNLVRHAEESLLTLAAGTNLTAREAIRHQVHELRAKLTTTASSPLEHLLIDRIVISWVEVYHGDIELAAVLLKQLGTAPAARAAQHRLDGAQRRYLAAVKQLAVVQKLLKPALSPLDLLKGSVPQAAVKGVRQRCSRPVAAGVPVAN